MQNKCLYVHSAKKRHIFAIIKQKFTAAARAQSKNIVIYHIGRVVHAARGELQSGLGAVRDDNFMYTDTL